MRDHGGSSVAQRFSRVGAEGGGRGMSELGLSAVPVTALILIFGVLVILLLIIWSIKRHRDPDLHIECDSPIEDLIPSLAGLTLATAVDGNTVDIFENGAYFEVLLAEIRSAKRTVHFDVFLWKEGLLGQRVAGTPPTAWTVTAPHNERTS